MGWITEGFRAAAGDRRYIHYLGGDGFTDVYICQNSASCTL